ncbi:hypothetical protein [Bacillus cereus]
MFNEVESIINKIKANKDMDYGNGQYAVEGEETIFKQSPLQIRLNKALEQEVDIIRSDEELTMNLYTNFSEQKPSIPFTVHIGPVASGAAVVACSNKIHAIKQQQRKF